MSLVAALMKAAPAKRPKQRRLRESIFQRHLGMDEESFLRRLKQGDLFEG
jgi:hypothetical protein